MKAKVEVTWVQCSGEAHEPGNMADHCMVCLPYWGEFPVCNDCGCKLPAKHRKVLKPGVVRYFCPACRKHFFADR